MRSREMDKRRRRRIVQSSSSDEDFLEEIIQSPNSDDRSEDNTLWTDKYQPRNISDLCVHKKKKDELMSWLKNGKGIAVCTGPSGAAKSTAINVMCSQLNYQTLSFHDLIDHSKHYFETISETGLAPHRSVTFESRMQNFAEFVSRSQRYRSLTNSGSASIQVALIEEFPTLQHPKDIALFRKICINAIRRCRYPIIFVLTSEYENRDDAFRVFGHEFLSHPIVSIFKFNAISVTAMRKALYRIIHAERVHVSASDIDGVISRSNGDIRSAIHQLQFEKVSISSSSSGIKDVQISPFHALGRILYSKETVQVPESVVLSSPLSDDSFVENLYENYLEFLGGSLESQCDVASSFSVADLLSQGSFACYKRVPPSYASSVACRSYINAKRQYGMNGVNWRPIYASSWRQYNRDRNERIAFLQHANIIVSGGEVEKWCVSLPYMCLILPINRIPEPFKRWLTSYSVNGRSFQKRLTIDSVEATTTVPQPGEM
uniref:Checkpoint protein RAD24-like helical bundle domain-containing protein n=1 Tax=Spongospora subterranea TaxID=70186 RepID=A0A0H5QH36_9EUKA|eukprot:CRZ01285.1 hypothetical protein [Spongospora subterranea]